MIVAQLSDIHLDGSVEAVRRLDAVLSWLRPLRPDALIVSGDLAEEEHELSYALVRERFEGLGIPFLLVPGNVDDHHQMYEAFAPRFGWPSARPLCVSTSVGGLRLIGLDVTVENAHHGDAAPVLEWLEGHLRADPSPTLIFQHQHPFRCGIDGKDRNICFNADRLAEVIQRAGKHVVALTCGHVHRPMFTSFAGRPASMSPAVARANRLRLDGRESAISDPPGLLLHHWTAGQLVTHVVSVS
jgi:Icc protein